ncbi:hypothetical protein NIE88_18660 [Sporolactobacillus shoreicorticis]|uniref:Uncharacterized protein n=1 Tax=Sporolactobacillus shoreicorticis TaxID=1923877 RepID=A0ABW5S6D6_9BACL|nr:hypothetical protein [Sporolactobacillus shoreicorticis]MCO7127771.1 hypothetical protein [Sporolactobacillus shoreicorticis]
MNQSHFAELVIFQQALAEQDLKTTLSLSLASKTDAEKGFYAGMAQANHSEIKRLRKLYEICLANEKNAGQGALN